MPIRWNSRAAESNFKGDEDGHSVPRSTQPWLYFSLESCVRGQSFDSLFCQQPQCDIRAASKEGDDARTACQPSEDKLFYTAVPIVRPNDGREFRKIRQ